MRAVRVLLAIAMLCCGAAYADSMESRGTASGKIVLWFSGTRITATFEGTFVLAGQLMLDDAAVPFSAEGWARGAGSGDSTTLDAEAWATFAASGSTEAGEDIVVQGGLALSGLSEGTGASAGSGAGDFFATVFIGGRQYYTQGTAQGSVTGAFVVPEDPYSMELAGDCLFNLSGEMTAASPASQNDDSAGAEDPDSESSEGSSLSALLPWDAGAWPAELLSQLLDILTRVIEIPTTEEAGSVND